MQLGRPLMQLPQRLWALLLLLAPMYQLLSSLPHTLALPMPDGAWALVSFWAPLLNLDPTEFGERAVACFWCGRFD
jgi:hypothetical protein